jgi:hypothetical protein
MWDEKGEEQVMVCIFGETISILAGSINCTIFAVL